MRFWILGASALFLMGCDGTVTDGGTGSDTNPERLEEMGDGDGMTESEEEAEADTSYGLDGEASADDPRLGDYPKVGEETTRLPIEPGAEEPGGKDALTEKELETMNRGDDPIVVTEPDGTDQDPPTGRY